MFYEFRQNNSGGSFDRNNLVDSSVIIEAESIEEAINISKDIGIYFDGVSKGVDCNCCGDRWHEPWEETEVPSHYGTELLMSNISLVKRPNEHTVVIHYSDGRVRYTTTA